MTKTFSPSPPPELTSVYTTQESKDWIKNQAKIHGVSMVAIIDEMVSVCDSITPKKRPNLLRPDQEGTE